MCRKVEKGSFSLCQNNRLIIPKKIVTVSNATITPPPKVKQSFQANADNTTLREPAVGQQVVLTPVSLAVLQEAGKSPEKSPEKSSDKIPDKNQDQSAPSAKEKKPEPGVADPFGTPVLKVGEQLRLKREALGYPLRVVAQEIKIKEEYLAALEAGRPLDASFAPIYIKGFLKGYAQLLGLPANDMLAAYHKEFPAVHNKAKPPVVRFVASAQQQAAAPAVVTKGFIVMIALFAAIVIYGVFYSLTRAPIEVAAIPALETVSDLAPPAQPNPTQPPAQQNPAQPLPADSPPAPPAEAAASAAEPAPALQPPLQIPGAPPLPDGESTPSATAGAPVEASPAKAEAVKPPSRIKVQAIQNTHVRIYDGKGRLLAERSLNTGEAFYVPDDRGYTLATDNAGMLKLQIDGRDMPPLGKADEAMHNIPLNPDELLQYLQ